VSTREVPDGRKGQVSTPCEQSFTGCAALLGNRTLLIVVGLLLAAGMLTLPPTGAAASRAGASPPQLISGTDRLSVSCDPTAPENGDRDWEQEPSLAVNPTNPENLVSAWIQDFADGIEVGFSTDGGSSWSNSLPPTDACTSGVPSMTSVIDPSLSFGPSFGPSSTQGIAYLSSLVTGSEKGAAIVNRSLDGGATWSKPSVLEEVKSPEAILTVNVAADPVRPGVVYAWWNKANVKSNTLNQFVAHTTDGGASWSTPTQVAPIHTGFPERGRLLVLAPTGASPEGTLVDVFSEIPSQSLEQIGPPTYAPVHGPTTMLAARSTDLGSTWSVPVVIAEADPTWSVIGEAALAPDRKTIYVGWQRVAADKSSFSLMYAKSRNGGRTWLQPRPVGGSIPGPDRASHTYLFVGPTVAVAPDGTVGVTFYDHRGDLGSKPPKVTDFWLRSSHNGGRTWEDTLLAGPFDQTTAPGEGATHEGAANAHCKFPNCVPPETAVEGFLGDYEAIAAIAGGFANTFALAEPLAGANFKLGSPPTDMFFDKVRTGRRHKH
jgi:hypothetical protein